MKQTLIHRVYDYILEHNLLPQGSSVLVGLSGGPDSVFLLHTLKQLQSELNITIYTAHLDHEWRSSSSQDMEFCKHLAASYNAPFFHEKASNINITTSTQGSWEAHGRLIRRSYFTSLQHKHNIDYIALAHHKDDQRETFFIRLLRGAGLTGLAGIQPQRGSYIHPLLDIEKREIFTFLKDHDMSYLTDPTNISETMLRNRVRHYLMPALEACDKRAMSSLDRTINNLQEADTYLQSHIEEMYSRFTHTDNESTWLHIPSLLEAHPYLRRQIILKWLIEHDVQFTPSVGLLQEIERFFRNQKSTTHQIFPKWQLHKSKSYVRLHKNLHIYK